VQKTTTSASMVDPSAKARPDSVKAVGAESDLTVALPAMIWAEPPVSMLRTRL
jgi:hypothetical protein